MTAALVPSYASRHAGKLSCDIALTLHEGSGQRVRVLQNLLGAPTQDARQTVGLRSWDGEGVLCKLQVHTGGVDLPLRVMLHHVHRVLQSCSMLPVPGLHATCASGTCRVLCSV